MSGFQFNRKAVVWFSAIIVAVNGFFPAVWIFLTALKTFPLPTLRFRCMTSLPGRWHWFIGVRNLPASIFLTMRRNCWRNFGWNTSED